ncbi:long-chain-fatty-acid--CoA ligase [Piscinibacter terrae]|uniref:Long-chain-fatty-acid--CoA ligase n=1 Tax=Piscinibacter terrae TaxID=2496871 RepID=A0A3N7IY59_9BURK|nr:long-chain fatty acid--CoA ligase [Albitalea terrae]RQP23692.1 long-chain fatty acid--CoA ligase [Albitalea terrae]
MTAHPWTQSYPDGLRWDVDLPVRPVHDIIDASAAQWPDLPALDFMGRKISYAELKTLTDRAAKGFQKLGVKPGVHVGLYLPNTPHYVIAFFGVLKAGGVVVNYSPLDAEKVLEHKVEDSETDLMVTLDLQAMTPQMLRLLDKTRLKNLVVGNVAEMSAAPGPIHEKMKQAGQVATLPDNTRIVSFAALLDNDTGYTRHDIGDPREALAVLQYTGGTTGQPKGAMLTHGNLTTACSQIWVLTQGDPKVLELGKEKLLVVLPLFHIYALTADMLFGLQIGAELVIHLRFELEAAMRDLSDKRITCFPGVPTMFTAVISHPDIAKFDLKALRHCNSGGAPLPLEVQQRFQSLTGCSLNEGWGMTETSPTGTFTPTFGKRKPGSCGLPVPQSVIKMVDVNDPSREVPLGERGEMCIKGPNVMKGYWKNPDATRASMTPDGFFRTGDVAIMDEDGFVFIVDRTKDMILCGGYNVYPRNIEEAIYAHPSVAEVSVIGIADEYRGQSPKAFIKLKDGAAPFTLDALKAFLADKLGKHEMVQAMDIRAELPKTPVGKLSKKELYAEEAAKHTSS